MKYVNSSYTVSKKITHATNLNMNITNMLLILSYDIP
jgi:hypothetical protein